MKFKSAPLAFAVSLGLMASNTLAQEFALEEIVVTATKRAVSLQNVALTVNAFSAETIEDAGLNNAVDVATITPSLTIATPLGPFSTRVNIRGIGTSGTDPANEPSVGIFVDGIYQSAAGLGLSDLTDIERIEVLQGPQGTLYGKNTNAGAISIITKQPNIESTEGYVEIQGGERNLRKMTAAVSGPLSDTLAYRVSGSSNQQDGYIKNSGGEDLGSNDDWNLSGKLAYSPSESLHVTLSAAHVEREGSLGGADATVSDATNGLLMANGYAADKNNPFDYLTGTSANTGIKVESNALSMVVDYDFDSGSLKSITAYDEFENSETIDADRTQLDIITFYEKRSGENFSQEIRFTSNSDQALEYQAGLFYYDGTVTRGDENFALGEIGEHMVASGFANTGSTAFALIAAAGDNAKMNHEWNTRTIATFGQTTWHVNEQLDFTAGLRWTDEEKQARLQSDAISTALITNPMAVPALPNGMGGFFVPTPEQRKAMTLAYGIVTPIDADWKRSSQNVDWMLKTSYNLSDDAMLFASASTGTKSGGFNGVSGLTRADREFDDEDTLSFELGLKSTTLDSRLRTNITAFRTEISDYQQSFQLPGGAGTSVRNEGEVVVSGIDLNLQARPLENLTLEAGLMYMKKAEITAGANKGDALFLVPEMQGNVAATLVIPMADGTLYTRADYSFMGDHTTGSDFVQNRELLNLKIGWRNENWNVSLWGKNLTDHAYASFTTENLSFAGTSAYILAPNRTIGATAKYNF